YPSYNLLMCRAELLIDSFTGYQTVPADRTAPRTGRFFDAHRGGGQVGARIAVQGRYRRPGYRGDLSVGRLGCGVHGARRAGLHGLRDGLGGSVGAWAAVIECRAPRSEEHTSELQSRENLVC